MKRKSLLFLLLMALFAPLAMNGQTTNQLLSQNFDGNGLVLYDNTYDSRGWYTYNAGSGNNWELYQSSTYAYSGSYSIAYAYNSSNAANCYLVSEPFTVSATMTQLSVSLYEKVMSDYYAETFEVFFIKASDVSSNTLIPVTSNQYSAIASADYTNESYAQVSGSSTSSALKGQSVRLVVHCTSIANMYRLYIDDITVTETTSGSSYITEINSNNDWNNFAQSVRNGLDYSGKTVNLNANISITSQSNQAGSNGNLFKGTFNGNGHTITVNMTATGDFCAPFYAIQNATINNLAVSGSITSSYHDAAGFCGGMYGSSTFNNCVSSVAITSTRSSYSDTRSACGGFAGKAGGGDNPTFVGCAFTGSLSAISEKWGGFIGFHGSRDGWAGDFGGRSTFTNCICAPTSINTNGITDNATFVSGYNQNQYLIMTVTNSYYNEEAANLGTKQGTRAYSVTGQSPATVAMAGNPSTQYSVSGIKVYSPGITLTTNNNTTIYAASGQTINLTLGGGSDYEADYGTLEGSGNSYSLTMEANNTVISAGSIDSYLISQEGNITTCSGTIYDSGGPNGNYSNSEDYTKTIYPGTPGMAVKLEFTVFETESVSYDYIEIYDGTSINATLIGKYGGTNSPGIVVASNPTGALTLKWYSDSSVNKTGFAAIISCGEPTPVVTISNVTANSATASWTGASSSYTVRFGMGFPTEGFESSSLPDGWSHIGNGTGAPATSYPHTGSNSLKFNGATSDNVVVLPQVVGSETQISFWSRAEGSSSGNFDLGYVTDATNVSSFVTLATYTQSQHSDYTYVENYSLASVPAGARVAFRHRSASTAWYWFIDDVVVSGSVSTATTSNTTYNITNLEPNCTYWVTVQGTNSEVSNPVLFQTPFPYKRFVTAGSWDNDNNWLPSGAPTIEEDVHIEANATIPSGVVATANEITINGGSITIADGGQLQHNNTGLVVTTQKSITGYGSGNANTNKGYYLISSPVDNIAASNVTGLQTTPHYDLYKFVSNNVEDGNLLEWVHVDGNLEAKTGYIYASEETTALGITGTVAPSATDIQKTLTYNEGYRFGGWNLIGNPFVCNAYVTRSGSDINFYVLNQETGDEFILANSTNAIAPMEGLMVQATSANQSVTYSRTAPSKGAGILNIDVNRAMDRGTATLDRARVRFGEGEGLQKFQFNPNHTKVYIPQDGNDYAVVYAEGAGTMPVNFKAEKNGHYTLNFTTENVNFNYLHLIDNRNGNDVDLLQTPYYAFDAKSTDFASRFTLVFATGNDNDDTFAFFNNGVWIINNDGKAELQVVDALGRILSSETISGSCSKAINAAPGVYMLRLINGNDVKVQKVVVR